MLSNVMLVLSTCILFGTLGLIAWRFARGLTDIIALFVLVFGLFYGLRAFLLAAHLDTPYPDRFFVTAETAELATQTILWLTAYLVCFAAGVYVTSECVGFRGTLLFARTVPDSSRMLVVTALLTLVATVISLYFIASFGSIGGFIRASKVDKTLAGLFFLKLPATMGAICAIATFLHLRRDRGEWRGFSVPALLCAFLNGFFVFLWGQRSVLVVLGVVLVLGTFAGQRGRGHPVRVLVAAVLAVLIVLGASAGLRVARDELVSGEVQSVVAEATLPRQVSIATNSIYFDSSLLAFRDWPADHPYRQGEDFVLGAAGAVPRLLWPSKPEVVVAGRWFRQVYQPGLVNGWPVGTPTLWWLNFGPLGILAGGLLSGLLYGALRRAQLNAQASGLNSIVAVVTAVYGFHTGFGPQWPISFTAWLAPLWLLVIILTRGDRRYATNPKGRSGEKPGKTAVVSVLNRERTISDSTLR